MTRSSHDMMRSGMISTKAYNSTLAQTRAQKSKMAKFDDKRKNPDDDADDPGHLQSNEINQAKHQRGGRMPTGPQRGGQPKSAHIDREQGPKFPAGGKAKANARKVGVSGGVKPSAPSDYGGPASRKYG